MRIEAMFFDVGETIVDETREYGTWADWFGVPRHTFSAVFGAVIARGGDYRETFEYFRPGFDLRTERERRAKVGQAERFGEEDLYPDARPCLAALRAQGVRVGLAGNQTSRAEAILRSLDLPVDVTGGCDRHLRRLGRRKPSDALFSRLTAEAGCQATAVMYVGDRLDNDIRPAQQAGLQTAVIRRGPWGYIQREDDSARRCLFRLSSLSELPDLVAKHNAAQSGD